MSQETHEALHTLEKELERLRAAVDHIDQAKGIAQKVVVAVAGVQKKYSEHLDALLGLHRSTIEQLGSSTTSRFDDLGAAAKRHILEAAARARKQFEDHSAEVQRALNEAGHTASERLIELSVRADQLLTQSAGSMKQLVEEAGSSAGGHVSQLGVQVRQLIDELGERTKRLMDDSTRDMALQLHSNSEKAGRLLEDFGETARSQVLELGARAHRHIEDLGSSASIRIEQLGELIRTGMQDSIVDAKKALEEANSQSIKIFAAIKKSHDQHTLEFEKLSVNTDAVITSAAKLVRAIDAVDFPEKLQTIQNDIRSLHFNLNSAMSRIDALDKSLENSLRAFTDDVVSKLGRVEVFIEKTMHSFEETTNRRFRDQQEETKKNRLMMIILLVFNIIILAGIVLLWSRDDAQPEQSVPSVQQVVHDTVFVPAQADEAKTARRRR